MDRGHVAIPALLALSAIHHHLVREGLRTTAGLVVETGSAREVHHFAVLAGYGAEAVHPYLAMETLADLHSHLPGALSADKAIYNYVKAIGKGLSKIMSKMGVSTYMSYCGAQLFEAIGLQKDFVEKYFRGTASQVGGIGVFEVAEEALRMHPAAFGNDPVLASMLDAGGEYAWRTRGEEHMWTPDAIAKLQHSVRARPVRHLQGIRADHQRPEQAPHDAARPVRVQGRPEQGHPDRRSRAGGRDRQALCHRRDVARLDQHRGPQPRWRSP
jgi:glutamate synthase (NADPH/NADH) large chain